MDFKAIAPEGNFPTEDICPQVQPQIIKLDYYTILHDYMQNFERISIFIFVNINAKQNLKHL